MSERSEKLLREALALPPEERTHLAAELLASVDGEPDADAEAAWAAEIDRRVAQVEAGTSQGEPWEAVRQRLQQSLKK